MNLFGNAQYITKETLVFPQINMKKCLYSLGKLKDNTFIKKKECLKCTEKKRKSFFFYSLIYKMSVATLEGRKLFDVSFLTR